MSLYAHLKALIDEYRYCGVPAALPKKPSRARQPGKLGPNQVAWLDEHMCVIAGEHKFKKWRLQAEAARGTTTAVVQVN